MNETLGGIIVLIALLLVTTVGPLVLILLGVTF